MLNRQLQAAQVLHSALVSNAPKDTWNLALNSIRIIQENKTYSVVIGGEIAPYAEFTNETWNNGVNPNEGWIEETIKQVLPTIKQIMSGALNQTEIEEYKKNNFEKQLVDEYQEFIGRKEDEYGNI